MQKVKKINVLSTGLTSNRLKMIAIVTMFIDHFSYLVTPSQTPTSWVMHFIGRVAAPIMCYLIAEGHHYTSDKEKYFLRLLLFAFLSHIPYVVYFDLPFLGATSIVWSLAMGLLALTGVSNDRHKISVKVGIVLAACLLAYNANWNYISVLWIVGFGLFRGNFKMQAISYTTIGLIFYIIQGFIRIGPHTSYRIGIFLPLLFIYFYNGELGKKTKLSKWSFYIFYPLHFIILYLLRLYVFNGFA